MGSTKKKATSAKAWKGKLAVKGSPIDLPSGNTALVRQISPQAFLTSGLIPDPLRPIVSQAINSKQGLKPQKLNNLMEDPKMMASAMEMFDRVVTFVVIEPEIVMPPSCGHVVDGEVCGEYATTDRHEVGPKFDHRYVEAERDEEVLYADEVDMTDKQMVFQWAMGGTRDLERFRAELPSDVGSASDG